MRRRWTLLWFASAAAIVGWFYWASETQVPRPNPAVDRTRAVPTRPETSAPASPETGSTLAAELNAPDGTIERDLLIVDSVLEAFRTNFAGAGNPVGDNSEITAALTGRNSLGLQLIPRRHPAINPRGELVDRWGTPFFLHQLSGDVMEIRSAGPDRTMHTADDAVLAQGG